MTDGGQQGTNGGASRWPIEGIGRIPPLLWWAYGAVLAVVAAVTATSFWMEAERFGVPVTFGTLILQEATSVVVIFALTWPLLLWTRHLSPARVGWLRFVAGHVAGGLAFSLVHVIGMVTLRVAIFGLLDRPYRFGPIWQGLLYELRKDLLVYAGMVAAILLLQRALERPVTASGVGGARTDQPADLRIEIRDGARRFWVEPQDVLWIESAGNYVELHTAERSHLWRRTLASVEAELSGTRFQRIHRSRLVNLAHVRAAANNDSGDFTLTLSNGAVIGGARRWREAFDRAQAG